MNVKGDYLDMLPYNLATIFFFQTRLSRRDIPCTLPCDSPLEKVGGEAGEAHESDETGISLCGYCAWCTRQWGTCHPMWLCVHTLVL